MPVWSCDMYEGGQVHKEGLVTLIVDGTCGERLGKKWNKIVKADLMTLSLTKMTKNLNIWHITVDQKTNPLQLN